MPPPPPPPPPPPTHPAGGMRRLTWGATHPLHIAPHGFLLSKQRCKSCAPSRPPYALFLSCGLLSYPLPLPPLCAAPPCVLLSHVRLPPRPLQSPPDTSHCCCMPHQAMERAAPHVELLLSLWNKLVFGVTVLAGLNLLRDADSEEEAAASPGAPAAGADHGSPPSVVAAERRLHSEGAELRKGAETEHPSGHHHSRHVGVPSPVPTAAATLRELGNDGSSGAHRTVSLDSASAASGSLLDRCGAAEAVLKSPAVAVRRRVIRAAEPTQ